MKPVVMMESRLTELNQHLVPFLLFHLYDRVLEVKISNYEAYSGSSKYKFL